MELDKTTQSFEDLLQKTTPVKPNGICHGRVISDIKQMTNGKKYIVVDIGAKKNYVVYAEEFETVPILNSEIKVSIINDGGHQQYGTASYLKAIRKENNISKNNQIKEILDARKAVACEVVAKALRGYEVKSAEISAKCMYITNREYKVGDKLNLYIRNITPYLVYMQNNDSTTSRFSVKQTVRCRIESAVSIMFMVQILDDKDNVIFPKNNTQIDCVLPFTELNKNAYEARNSVNVGDIIELQIIGIAPNRIILSKLALDNKDALDTLRNIAVGRIVTGTILEKTDRIYTLTADIDNEKVVCEIPMNEVAWSVAQREYIQTSNILEVGKTVRVKVIGTDMRTGRIQVSYKLCNLSNPISLFASEINPVTNAHWKVGDTINVKATFEMVASEYRQFCYVNYKEVDMIMHNWKMPEVLKAINAKESFEVVILSMNEELNGNCKIFVAHVNDEQLKFNSIMKQFVQHGTYKCTVTGKMRSDYIIKPLEYSVNNTYEPIDMTEITGVNFYIRNSDTTERLVEGQTYICKLVYVDNNRKCVYFSINAYNEDQNRRTVHENRITTSFNIGNS